MTTSALRALVLALVAGSPSLAQEPAVDFERHVRPFLAEFCTACHGVTDPEADLDLVGALGGRMDQEALDVVLDLRDVLRAHDMPPAEESQPDAAQRALVIGWAERLLAHADGELPPDPGRVTMRRLSRYEFANTVRGLLGVEVDVAEFPVDDLGYGFDNVGETLTLSTIHLEKYAAAAERVVAAAFPDPDPVPPPTVRLGVGALSSTLEDAIRGDALVLLTNARAWGTAQLLRPGRYRVRAIAHATQAGDELARLELRIDDQTVQTFDVTATRDGPAAHEFEATVTRDSVRVTAAFVNDFYDPKNPDPRRRDRNIYLHGLEVEGPLDAREVTVAEDWLRPFDRGRGSPASRARPILRAFLPRAWRRPVSRGEIGRFAQLVESAVAAGESFDAGVRWALQAALVSPHFLFRVEPTSGASSAGIEAVPSHALASRLSYFLWSTLPDAALMTAARAGGLADDESLVAEARRMLADPRASALAKNFAAQWLELRRLSDISPDPARFPTWDTELAASARRETELLFDTVLRERLPVTALVDSDFTFVDGRLARHYGFPEVEGDAFVRVPLDGRRVGGVLGHVSFLALTSNPTRTSPVRRGKWILDNLLDDPPPPPPPGNDSFAAEASIDSAASLREQMALHRRDPSCAACHVRMDAIGLALEGFDPIGRRRETDGGGAVDTRTTLPDGRVLTGARDLARVLATDPALRAAILRKLFVYAVGRGVRPADALAIERIALRMPAESTLEDLILETVRMDAFRRRAVID